MIKYIALIIIVAVRILYHPSAATSATTPFANPSTPPVSPVTLAPASPVQPESVKGNNKVVLHNVTVENNHAETIPPAANLVFGIEKPQTGYSLFINHTVIQKMFYRIGLINKNRAATC